MSLNLLEQTAKERPIFGELRCTIRLHHQDWLDFAREDNFDVYFASWDHSEGCISFTLFGLRWRVLRNHKCLKGRPLIEIRETLVVQ